MKKIIVKQPGRPVIISPQKNIEREKVPEQPAPRKPMSKGIFNRIADIVLEDIKVKLGKDKKSRERKEIHNDFIEQHFPEMKK